MQSVRVNLIIVLNKVPAKANAQSLPKTGTRWPLSCQSLSARLRSLNGPRQDKQFSD